MLPTSKRLVNTILKIGNTHWGLHGHLVVDWKLKWTTDIYMKMDIFDTIVMNWSRHQLVQEIIICQFIIKPNQLVICICHQFLVFKSKQSNHSNDLIKCKLIRQHQKLKSWSGNIKNWKISMPWSELWNLALSLFFMLVLLAVFFLIQIHIQSKLKLHCVHTISIF